MSQRSSGLRFDIYERVHLPDHKVGILELNEIELAPDITVVEQGEQAVLKGHLVLTGTYAGQDEAKSEERLEHRIPVEITLPLNRIENFDELEVEIENFDVDVLSDRSLNVTGVLSLNGIEMVSAPETGWRQEEEAFFTHRVEDQVPPAPPAPPATPAIPAPPPLFMAASEVVPPPPNPVNAPAMEMEAAEEAKKKQKLEPAMEEKEKEKEEAEAVEAAEAEEKEMVEAEAENPFLAIAEPPKPEKQEIKIAFAGKLTDTSEAPPIGVNTIMSMAAGGATLDKRPDQPPPEYAIPAAQAAQAAPAAPSASAAPAPAPSAQAGSGDSDPKDKLEWKRLFLQSSAEAPSFRKVRMCIAQKEDTIETIAERYKKSARELMLYNRINEEYLREGQVVYIP